MTFADLPAACATACPLVLGIEGTGWDRSTWRAVYREAPTQAQGDAVQAVMDACQQDPVDMPARRQNAFEAAMAYGNAITARITGAYADAEARSWTVQEGEARAVLKGDTLPDGAMLPQLAADKGIAPHDYAASVIQKADAFRRIAVAAVRLRRGAERLLAPEIDTLAALAAAVEALRGETLAAATALGIAV